MAESIDDFEDDFDDAPETTGEADEGIFDGDAADADAVNSEAATERALADAQLQARYSSEDDSDDEDDEPEDEGPPAGVTEPAPTPPETKDTTDAQTSTDPGREPAADDGSGSNRGVASDQPAYPGGGREDDRHTGDPRGAESPDEAIERQLTDGLSEAEAALKSAHNITFGVDSRAVVPAQSIVMREWETKQFRERELEYQRVIAELEAARGTVEAIEEPEVEPVVQAQPQLPVVNHEEVEDEYGDLDRLTAGTVGRVRDILTLWSACAPWERAIMVDRLGLVSPGDHKRALEQQQWMFEDYITDSQRLEESLDDDDTDDA